jgi:prokaryotic ubiquitin-like protein Pup
LDARAFDAAAIRRGRIRKETDVPQEQEQKRTQKRGGGGGEDADDAGQVASSPTGEKLKEEMDDILDEIDSVLEENAEEFVKSYVQKGGE